MGLFVKFGSSCFNHVLDQILNCLIRSDTLQTGCLKKYSGVRKQQSRKKPNLTFKLPLLGKQFTLTVFASCLIAIICLINLCFCLKRQFCAVFLTCVQYKFNKLLQVRGKSP